MPSVNPTVIARHMSFAWVFVDADVPTSGTKVTITGGVPAGAQTVFLGATQGGATVTFKPTIALVDIDQAYGGVGEHMTSEAMSINTTMLELDVFKMELMAQQGTRHNYAPNNSFETDTDANGTADSWNQSGTSTRTIQTSPQAAYGAKAQQFVSGGAAGGIISDPIAHPAFDSGKILVFSAYVKSGSGTPNVRVKIEAFDGSDVSIGSAASTPAATSTTYARFSVSYTLPSDAAYVKLTVEDSTGQTATLLVDNVQLEIVASGSTPSTYAANDTLFLGGRTDVVTRSVCLTEKWTDANKYTAAMIYAAYSGDGLTVNMQRGTERKMPLTLTGIPVQSRPAGDQIGSWQQDQ